MTRIQTAQKAIDIIIYLNDKPLGGQKNATLNCRTAMIDITNKITGEWVRSIPGKKSWSITCSGLSIKDNEAFNELQEAYLNGATLTIKLLEEESLFYNGKVLISSFPLGMNYNNSVTYSLVLNGTGELKIG